MSTSKWVPLHLHSHFSLQDGLSKPSQIAKRCIELGYDTCAITDHGNVAASVGFSQAMEKAKIKPILGCELYLSPDARLQDASNRSLSHLVVLAKNQAGWRKLIAATSEANKPEFYYYRPRLDLDNLANFLDGNIIGFSGHMGSDLSNCLFADLKEAYNASENDGVRMHPNYRERAIALVNLYQDIFGKENFFMEIQRIDQERLYAAKIAADVLTEIAIEMGVPRLATADSHYPRKEDAEDQRVLLCSSLQTTFSKVNAAFSRGDEVGLGGFFKSNNYHIPSLQEMEALHTEDELANSLLIADMCENYSILNQPRLPQFNCPGGISSDEYVRELCRNGWREKIQGIVNKEKYTEYADRVKYELSVLQTAGLSPYFLIVQDYTNFFRRRGHLIGAGRGSAAGSLVAYLLNITSVDPIPNGLIFERFYNAGRNAPGRVSLPDVDMDFPIYVRRQVIEYIKDRYGRDKVGQIATYGRMQGKGAIKDVLRAYGEVGNDEMNRITAFIPDEQEIMDQLQEMRKVDKEEGGDGDASIIEWALSHHPKGLEEWCVMNDDGSLSGPLAPRFEQAIRLEGTRKSQSTHAAGIVISTEVLSEVCPMIRSKSSDELIVGIDMNDAEAMGHIKFDILGTAVLDKIQGVQNLLQHEPLIK
jgi:DNA polymerase-3 subunit alpha